MSKCFCLWQEFCLAQERRNKLKLTYFLNVNIFNLQQRNDYLHKLLKNSKVLGTGKTQGPLFFQWVLINHPPPLELFSSSSAILLLSETHFLWYGNCAGAVFTFHLPEKSKHIGIWQKFCLAQERRDKLNWHI